MWPWSVSIEVEEGTDFQGADSSHSVYLSGARSQEDDDDRIQYAASRNL